MREMEGLLQAEKDQTAILQTQVEQLERRTQTYQQESKQLQVENERLQEMLEIK
jgi:regulator of replication initiation timing